MSDLTELGLSSYEAAAYRALLSLGRAPASDVAAAADVPKGRVYDVLNGLAARDVVRAHEGEPRRYEAVTPERAVDRLLAERERELAAEREHYEAVAADVSTELSRTLPLDAQFWRIGLGSDDAVAGMHEQFDRADDRLYSVVGPPYGDAAFDDYSDEVDAYADLIADDVEVKLLTTPAILDAQPAGQLAAAAAAADEFVVRTLPALRLSYDVLDGAEVYLSLSAPFEPGERVGGTVVRDEEFAAAMAARFRSAWTDATPVDPTAAADD